MKGRQIILTCALAAIGFAGSVMANEIYKWTDENGNIHYEDRPRGATTEQRLSLTYQRTDSSAVQNRIQSQMSAREAREEAKTAAAEAEQEAADEAAAEAERQQACERARDSLERYMQARRIYRTDANGERVYLDDTQRQEARQKAEDQVSEFCS